MARTVLSLLLLPLVACADNARVDTILGLTGDADAGGEVYAANCASCHGAGATGGTERGILGESAAETAEIVLNGEDSMPAFADTLEDQEIADLLAWLDVQG